MTNDLETFRHYLSIARVRNPTLEKKLQKDFEEPVPMSWVPEHNNALDEADAAVYEAMKASGNTPQIPRNSLRLSLIKNSAIWEWRTALAQYRDAHRAAEQEKWAVEQTRALRTKMEKHL